MYKGIILPASILIGTIIGAGMFSLPFVFHAAGFLSAIFCLLFFGVVFICLYVFYADLILRTPGEHRFVGYARIYLGGRGFWSALVIGLIQLFFVLTVYLVLSPSFSQLILPGEDIYHLAIFWLIGSIFILLGIKSVALSEFLMVGGMIGIIAIIFLSGLGGFLSAGLDFYRFNFSDFLVVGPIIFALSGVLAVPEVISYFKESKNTLTSLKKSLIIGGFVPALVYLLFVVAVIGLSNIPSEDAVSGLIGRVPAFVLALVGALGFLAIISSYIVVGVNARRILELDMSLPKWLSGLAVVFVPPIIYFLGFRDFIVLAGFIGTIFLPIENIFVLLMWQKSLKESIQPPILAGRILKYLTWPLVILFLIVLLSVLI